MKDYYKLLGLTSKATKAEIKKNYRRLATAFHPDKNSDSGAAEKFIAITEAYDVLSNKKSRAQYDLMKWESLKRAEAQADDFVIVTPPRESLRSRRNKAQKKRSVNYNKADGQLMKSYYLIKESLFMVSRYVLHTLGISLILVILKSALIQISFAFETGLVIGLGTCLFILLLTYGLFKIAENCFVEFRKDIVHFSVNYKILQKDAAFFSLSTAFFVLLIYIIVIMLRL